jgi:hypothetical protein
MLIDGHGHRAWLADGVHDLRAVSREMARAAGLPDCYYATNSWQSSFARAVSGLEERRLISLLWSVPMEAIESEFSWPSNEIEGDLFLKWFSRQRRFAKV